MQEKLDSIKAALEFYEDYEETEDGKYYIKREVYDMESDDRDKGLTASAALTTLQALADELRGNTQRYKVLKDATDILLNISRFIEEYIKSTESGDVSDEDYGFAKGLEQVRSMINNRDK